MISLKRIDICTNSTQNFTDFHQSRKFACVICCADIHSHIHKKANINWSSTHVSKNYPAANWTEYIAVFWLSNIISNSSQFFSMLCEIYCGATEFRKNENPAIKSNLAAHTEFYVVKNATQLHHHHTNCKCKKQATKQTGKTEISQTGEWSL